MGRIHHIVIDNQIIVAYAFPALLPGLFQTQADGLGRISIALTKPPGQLLQGGRDDKNKNCISNR